jgi:uncharacterized membrane protein YgdD (TMEM256/DUF423 family)
MWITLPLVLAGLMGAAGVALAALAAHAAPGTGLDGASRMLLIHAVAVLAAGALTASGRLWNPAAHLATAGWIVGGVLFAGDVALRALTGHRLFPMAAPTGGILLIVAWLIFALAAVASRRS